ncbi:GTP-binding protein [Terasakiella sp. A23]|uniref:CobW family GTP-binding protein n=1 Tax=Terasakiella sp. FCG-A23 TaxID=3080561 RepID=UPI002955CD80|nr:GTP-binding protein [Terasakiella sp. A23]MDV7340493.1 GTP-binding protein [Terasakiella sp. A23]
MADKIPVSVLTGFLGSGKSTLLSDILQTEEFGNTAVIVNEFGEVGLDDFLVVHSDEQIVEMTTGCLCCTVRGDITETMLHLLENRKEGYIKAFDQIIIETTGLADPAPVIHTLTTHPQLMSHIKLNGALVTLDAVNGLHTLDQYDECVKQIALADRIVLTKTDMGIDPAALHDLNVKTRQINQIAELIDKPTERKDLPALFEFAELDEKASHQDLSDWLGIKSNNHDHGYDHHHDHDHHDHGHSHDHHPHDHHHHGNIHTFTITIDEPVNQQAFVLAMQMLISNQGKDLLRMKGVINLAEVPERPYIIHGVQHVFHEPAELPAWPDDNRQTTIVFITRDIPKETIELYFKTWLNPDRVEMLQG